MADPVKGEKYKVTWGESDVPGVLNFSRTSNTGEIDTTDFDSGEHKEFVPGDSDHTFSLEFQLEPGDSDQEAALSDWENKEVDTLGFEPVTPAAGMRTWSAEAFATNVSDTYERENTVRFSVTFRVTGAPTITVAT